MTFSGSSTCLLHRLHARPLIWRPLYHLSRPLSAWAKSYQDHRLPVMPMVLEDRTHGLTNTAKLFRRRSILLKVVQQWRAHDSHLTKTFTQHPRRNFEQDSLVALCMVPTPASLHLLHMAKLPYRYAADSCRTAAFAMWTTVR